MSWLCSVCEKSFSRKDSMQRHAMSKHRNAGLTPFQTVPMSSQKCQRFRFEHPFTSKTSGMTKSGKAAWVLSLLHQASEAIYLPPERIVWCYSQWQPAYTEMLVAMLHIEFIKGIPTALEQDSYFDVKKQNLIVFEDQMIDASKDKRIVNLFTRVVLIIEISARFKAYTLEGFCSRSMFQGHTLGAKLLRVYQRFHGYTSSSGTEFSPRKMLHDI